MTVLDLLARGGQPWRRIGVVLVAGLLLRLAIAQVLLPGEGLRGDLSFFRRWALALADHGPGGFFANAASAEYPPGYLWILWPLGVAGRLLGGLTDQSGAALIQELLKLPAIGADIAIAWLLYREGRARLGHRPALAAAALYLFVPFTWYEAAVFGQMDSVGTLFVLLSLLLLVRGWSEGSMAAIAVAVMIKPQYAIFLAVVAPVLVHRHLLGPGSGPIPSLQADRLPGRIDARLGGWFTRQQGPGRLVSSGLIAGLVAAVMLMPFDIWRLAPPPLTYLPLVDHLRGLAALTGDLAAHYPVLTANAFNAWALIGPTPLTHEMSRSFYWTDDSLAVLGAIPAVTVGAAGFLGLAGLVAWRLLRRDGWVTIFAGAALLALGFFILPTRVHERYQFPVFAFAAYATAMSVRWRWWYVALGVLGTVNLHAVVTLAMPGFASPGLIGAPFGDLARSDAVIAAVAIGHGLLFLAGLVAWLRDRTSPSVRFPQGSRGGTARPAAIEGAAGFSADDRGLVLRDP